MCYGCYEEYGKPKIVNAKTIKAARLTDEVYKFTATGGLCHIVIDDFNIDDSDIDFCLENIAKREWDTLFTEAQYKIQESCMNVYKKLSIDERASALAIHEGWINT